MKLRRMSSNGAFDELSNQHVASNRHTRYRPYPSPAQIAASQSLCSRILKFVRRELRVWEGLDTEVCARAQSLVF